MLAILMGSGAVLCASCHSSSTHLATAPQPSAAECAGVVAPAPGDTNFKRLLPPLLYLPLQGPIIRTSATIPPAGADVRVNASGVVDSVVVDRIAAPVEENALRHALLRARAKPALYQGCPVTAWTVYTGTN